MSSVVALLAEASEAAASAFEDRDYLTKFGSVGEADPWDDATLPKDGWVGKVIGTFESKLPKPEVQPHLFF
jgi:hypothetical protein